MVSRLIAEMIEEGLLLRQGKQFILLRVVAGEKCDSGNQPKELSGSKVSPASPRCQPTPVPCSRVPWREETASPSERAIR